MSGGPSDRSGVPRGGTEDGSTSQEISNLNVAMSTLQERANNLRSMAVSHEAYVQSLIREQERELAMVQGRPPITSTPVGLLSRKSVHQRTVDFVEDESDFLTPQRPLPSENLHRGLPMVSPGVQKDIMEFRSVLEDMKRQKEKMAFQAIGKHLIPEDSEVRDHDTSVASVVDSVRVKELMSAKDEELKLMGTKHLKVYESLRLEQQQVERELQMKIEEERKAHDRARDKWDKERLELNEKILQLQSQLRAQNETLRSQGTENKINVMKRQEEELVQLQSQIEHFQEMLREERESWAAEETTRIEKMKKEVVAHYEAQLDDSNRKVERLSMQLKESQDALSKSALARDRSEKEYLESLERMRLDHLDHTQRLEDQLHNMQREVNRLNQSQVTNPSDMEKLDATVKSLQQQLVVAEERLNSISSEHKEKVHAMSGAFESQKQQLTLVLNRTASQATENAAKVVELQQKLQSSLHQNSSRVDAAAQSSPKKSPQRSSESDTARAALESENARLRSDVSKLQSALLRERENFGTYEKKITRDLSVLEKQLSTLKQAERHGDRGGAENATQTDGSVLDMAMETTLLEQNRVLKAEVKTMVERWHAVDVARNQEIESLRARVVQAEERLSSSAGATAGDSEQASGEGDGGINSAFWKHELDVLRGWKTRALDKFEDIQSQLVHLDTENKALREKVQSLEHEKVVLATRMSTSQNVNSKRTTTVVIPSHKPDHSRDTPSPAHAGEEGTSKPGRKEGSRKAPPTTTKATTTTTTTTAAAAKATTTTALKTTHSHSKVSQLGPKNVEEGKDIQRRNLESALLERAPSEETHLLTHKSFPYVKAKLESLQSSAIVHPRDGDTSGDTSEPTIATTSASVLPDATVNTIDAQTMDHGEDVIQNEGTEVDAVEDDSELFSHPLESDLEDSQDTLSRGRVVSSSIAREGELGTDFDAAADTSLRDIETDDGENTRECHSGPPVAAHENGSTHPRNKLVAPVLHTSSATYSATRALSSDADHLHNRFLGVAAGEVSSNNSAALRALSSQLQTHQQNAEKLLSGDKEVVEEPTLLSDITNTSKVATALSTHLHEGSLSALNGSTLELQVPPKKMTALRSDGASSTRSSKSSKSAKLSSKVKKTTSSKLPVSKKKTPCCTAVTSKLSTQAKVAASKTKTKLKTSTTKGKLRG